MDVYERSGAEQLGLYLLRLTARMQSPARVAEIRCLMCELTSARVPPSPGLLGEHALDGPFIASGKSYDEPVVQGLSAGACRFGVFDAGG